MIPLEIRRELIEAGDNQISISKQCELLRIARSTLLCLPIFRIDIFSFLNRMFVI